VGESCCRLQLFLCLVVEIWIMWDGCSVFGAAQPLASPCQGEGDRRRRWKGGYVAESDIVTTGDMTYCFLLRSDRAVRNVSTPQSRLRRASPPWQGGPRGLSNFATKCNLLLLLQEEARGSALLQQQQLSPQNPVFINLTSMRRRLKGPTPQQYGCST